MNTRHLDFLIQPKGQYIELYMTDFTKSKLEWPVFFSTHLFKRYNPTPETKRIVYSDHENFMPYSKQNEINFQHDDTDIAYIGSSTMLLLSPTDILSFLSAIDTTFTESKHAMPSYNWRASMSTQGKEDLSKLYLLFCTNDDPLKKIGNDLLDKKYDSTDVNGHISRVFANQLILLHEQHLLSDEWNEVVEQLKWLMKNHKGSLSIPIYQLLNPIHTEDSMIKDMIDPGVPHQVAAFNSLRFIKQTLHTKPDLDNTLAGIAKKKWRDLKEKAQKKIIKIKHSNIKKKRRQIDEDYLNQLANIRDDGEYTYVKNVASGKVIEVYKQSDIEDPVHKAIQDWFREFYKVRKERWSHLLNTLNGYNSDTDNDPMEKYLSLIGDADFTLNANGLIEYHFSDNILYKTYFHEFRKPIEKDDFYKTIHLIFHQLGLKIHPNCRLQEKVTFTQESSTVLMNLGMHFSQDYFKLLMKSTHDFRLFRNIAHRSKELVLPQGVSPLIVRYRHPTTDTSELMTISKNLDNFQPDSSRARK